MLSGMDRRRDLVNVDGSVLRTSFSVATVMDLDKLHDSVNKLYDTQSDLVHSVIDMNYKCTEVTEWVDYHNWRLLLTVPIKAFDRQFSLYRLVMLTHRIGNSQNFVQLIVKFLY
jgi:hypothetical protein